MKKAHAIWHELCVSYGGLSAWVKLSVAVFKLKFRWVCTIHVDRSFLAFKCKCFYTFWCITKRLSWIILDFLKGSMNEVYSEIQKGQILVWKVNNLWKFTICLKGLDKENDSTKTKKLRGEVFSNQISWYLKLWIFDAKFQENRIVYGILF